MSLRKCALVLAAALIALSIMPVPAQAQQSSPPLAPTSTQQYVVRAGDTLFSIAMRYHTNAATLAQLNGIYNPVTIYVGQAINVPAPAATPTPAPSQMAAAGDMVHVVQPGETLFRIALKYGTTVWALANYNKLDNASLLYAGQRILIPSGSKNSSSVPAVGSLPYPFVSVDVGPLPVLQGNTVVISVLTSRAASISATFLDWAIPFIQEGNAYYGLVGIHAMQKVGIFPLTIIAIDEMGKQSVITMSIQVAAGKFGSETIDVPDEQQGLLAPATVTAERNKLTAISSPFTAARYWTGAFRMPTTGHITSNFGSRRAYVGGIYSNYHEGIDFWGANGAPVYAPADGVIAFTGKLAVHGNTLIIDHGWGVFSGLYHLSEFVASPGERVRQGDIVARIGGTGLSTGSHLHWDVKLHGLNVDPLQWTRRIFP